MSVITVPLSKLHLSPINVRDKAADHDTSDIEAPYLAHRWLSPLLVHKLTKPRGAYGVLAGGRRLLALQRLRDRGEIPADEAVPVTLREDDTPALEELSIIENTSRVALPPAQEFRAFAKLADGGASLDEIAKRFATTVLHVRQRMQLGRLHPEILSALEAGRMTLDTAKAYAGTSDLALQKRVFDQRLAHDYEVRAALKRDLVNAGADRMLSLVTMDGYTAAGGRAEEDLFAPGEARVLDLPLLKQLYDAKLADEREELQLPDNVTLQFDHGGVGTAVEIVDDLTEDQQDRVRALSRDGLCIDLKLERIAEWDGDGPAGRYVAIAGADQDEVKRLVAERDRLTTEREAISASAGFPDGPLIAIAKVVDGGLKITSYHRPLGWRPAPIGGVASKAADVAPASPAVASTPADDAAKPVISGFRQDRAAYSGVYRQPEEVAREEHGLTKDAVEVMRSHQRQILSAAMLDGTIEQRLSHRVLIYVLARGMLGASGDADYIQQSRAPGLGVHSLPRHDHDPAQARPDLADQPAAKAIRDEIDWLRGRPWMTETDPASGLRKFAIAVHADFERAAAIVATTMLSRSLGVPGFRVSTHDTIAELLNISSKVRLHFTPDKAFFARLSKNEKLKALEFVSPALAKRLGSKSADDLSEACALVMSGSRAAAEQFGLSAVERLRAEGWVPPYLSFEPEPEEPDADEEEAA